MSIADLGEDDTKARTSCSRVAWVTRLPERERVLVVVAVTLLAPLVVAPARLRAEGAEAAVAEAEVDRARPPRAARERVAVVARPAGRRRELPSEDTFDPSVCSALSSFLASLCLSSSWRSRVAISERTDCNAERAALLASCNALVAILIPSVVVTENPSLRTRSKRNFHYNEPAASVSSDRRVESAISYVANAARLLHAIGVL